MDGLLFLLLIGFFGLAIYWTVVRAPSKTAPPAAPPPPPPSIPPSPVGLFCSSCGILAGTVNHEEYTRLSAGGAPVYCGRCMSVIEAYKRQQTQRP